MEKLKIGNRVKVTIKNGFFLGEVLNSYPDNFYIRTDEGFTTYVPYDSDWEEIPSSKKIEYNKRPKHYGEGKFDLIDVWCERYSTDELRGAFKSQLSKYVDRLGYKDDEVDELDKIIDYATRYRNHLKKVGADDEK